VCRLFYGIGRNLLVFDENIAEWVPFVEDSMSKYTVEFKGTKEGVTIYCQESAGFEEILLDLAERLRQRAVFFGQSKVRIDVGSRQLTEAEQEQLADVLAQNSKLVLAGVQTSAARPAETSLARRRGETADLKLENCKEGRSIVIKRTLRSGQSVHYPGNVIVLGDVNPGAEIVAEGDIFVYGTLRGIAHAGRSGDRSASVVALRLAPTQLRIASVISRAPDESSLPNQPEYAYISEDRIMIAAVNTK
jgi:septum site-determining protein MinC